MERKGDRTEGAIPISSDPGLVESWRLGVKSIETLNWLGAEGSKPPLSSYECIIVPPGGKGGFGVPDPGVKDKRKNLSHLCGNYMRMNLKVPYEQKDLARRLGAQWDPARKLWYVVDVEDLTPFMGWVHTSPKPTPQVSLIASVRKRFLDENGHLAYHTGPTFLGKSAKFAYAPWEDAPCSPILPSNRC